MKNVEWVLTVVMCIVLGWFLHIWWEDPTNHEALHLEYKYKTQTYRVTAYCACEKCCGVFADGITANGHKIKRGDRFVAAPKNIPFGTILNIPGYGKVPVWDRGGSITEGRLDVYFDTHQEALEWGVKILEVRL